MAVVPEGKTVYINQKKYKAGDELPAGYVHPWDKKKDAPPKEKRYGDNKK